MDVYALLIYGVMLFLHIEDYVDLAAVDAFLAKRDRGENPKWEGAEMLHVSTILIEHGPPFPQQKKGGLPHRRLALELD
ncbi:hypothetical protein CR513_44282, partial [Mucuna pruriens]